MTDEKAERQYKPKSDAELEQLAQDIYAGRIFTSQHCEPGHITLVFMVLALCGKDDIEWFKANDVTLFYEYVDKAGPRSVNGNPCFLSLQYLDREDHKKLDLRYQEIKAFMDARKVE